MQKILSVGVAGSLILHAAHNWIQFFQLNVLWVSQTQFQMIEKGIVSWLSENTVSKNDRARRMVWRAIKEFVLNWGQYRPHLSTRPADYRRPTSKGKQQFADVRVVG